MTALLRALVRLLPASFRRQFEDDILEQIHRDSERAAARGPLWAIAFGIGTALDLVGCAALERWRPSWPANRLHHGGRGAGPRNGKGLGENMNGWIRDLRQAARTLRHSPGFTVITVGTLALAIGANAGIFSVVDTVLLDAMPYQAQDRLVSIGASAPGSDFPEEFGVSSEFYLEYSEESALLEDLATFNSGTASLRVGDRVERLPMVFATSSLFSTLSAGPVLGRLPAPEDEDDLTVISHSLWQNWFGSDPEVIGRSYEIAESTRTIIGVMGPDFWFPNSDIMLWNNITVREAENVGRFGLRLVGRTAPGVEQDALVSELTQLASRLPEEYGGSAAYARLIEQHRPVVRPLDEEIIGSVSGVLWVLLGSAGIVLLIACANLANLFLVRAEGRQRALALRRALGARPRELIRSQMAEVLVVAALAGALAVFLAWAVVPLFLRFVPNDVPRIAQVAVSGDTLLFTLAATVAAAILCGVLPALRSSSPKLTHLREGGRGSVQGSRWSGDALVVLQTSLALVLLIGSGLLGRSFWQLRNVDPGYETADIFTFQMAPEREDLNDGPSFASFHQNFMERLRAIPAVESVGIVENLPLNEGTRGERVVTEGVADEDAPLLQMTFSAGDYFETMGISVTLGRDFQPTDQRPGDTKVVVSEAAARLLWPDQDALGKRLRPAGAEWWATVVGVVENVMQQSLRDTPDPLIYFPLVGPEPDSWLLSSPAYVVKSSRAESLAPEIRALVRELAPSAPMYRVSTMRGLVADSTMQLSFTMLTLAAVSAMALILGSLGLYGVLSYVVAQRTQEIGVRMALGAEAARVRRMVVVQGVRVVAVGVGLGVVVALASTRVLGSMLYEVEAVDLGTFLTMSVAMLLVGLSASYLPARRASGVDPVEALRGE